MKLFFNDTKKRTMLQIIIYIIAAIIFTIFFVIPKKSNPENTILVTFLGAGVAAILLAAAILSFRLTDVRIKRDVAFLYTFCVVFGAMAMMSILYLIIIIT